MTKKAEIRPVADILRAMRDPSAEDRALVEKAYAYSESAHREQKRYSGEPYFIHVAEVGYTLAEMGMDPYTIAAGLLHDTVEDAHVTVDEIKAGFGSEIAFLVDGVTKLGTLKYRGLDRHVESLRKLFVATAKDLRVIIVKLADRLHNVSTLKYVPEHKRQRIALETLEIYAPIANRLSIGKMKGELEDFSFPYAYPEQYAKVKDILKQRVLEDEKRLERFYRAVRTELAQNGITDVHGEYRIKRMYSLYKKLLRYDMDIDKIYDIAAIRVIVPTVGDCYRALGLIHGKYRPLPGRIKDYIAFPKPNGYQSLHTTIFTGDGSIVEVQLRTPEMDREAAWGVAAHFAYKEGRTTKKEREALAQQFGWVHEVSALHHDVPEKDAYKEEYLEDLKTDFFGDRVFVFTPRGDVIDLPHGAFPIDFAYAVHSDIGDRVAGAKVNGKMASLDTELGNGDIVEIITKKSAKPSKKWLEYAKTTAARRHIRQAIIKAREG